MLISVFGHARVLDRDITSKRQRQLLSALVMHRGSFVDADRLVEMIWADDPPNDPVAALYTQISRLRRILPDMVTIISARGGYRLDAPIGSIDIDDAIAWRAKVNRVPSAARATAIADVLALFKGVPFADLDTEEVLAHRERLAAIRLTVLEASAQE